MGKAIVIWPKALTNLVQEYWKELDRWNIDHLASEIDRTNRLIDYNIATAFLQELNSYKIDYETLKQSVESDDEDFVSEEDFIKCLLDEEYWENFLEAYQ